MADLLTVASREFSDTVRSRRFILLVGIFALIMIASMVALISEQTSDMGAMPSSFLGGATFGMTATMTYLAPIIGIALGCDAISGEYEKGSLKLVLAQPIYRDAVINGKFLAATIAITLATFIPSFATVGGAVLYLGVSPTPIELARLSLYLIFSVLFAMTFYIIAALLSTIAKKTSQSVMLSVGIWAAFVFIVPLIANIVARIFVGMPTFMGVRNDTARMDPAVMEQMRSFRNMEANVESITPNHHFETIGRYLLGGFSGERIGGIGQFGEIGSMSVLESLGQCWSNIVILVLYAVFAFVASYIVFTRQEIR